MNDFALERQWMKRGTACVDGRTVRGREQLKLELIAAVRKYDCPGEFERDLGMVPRSLVGP